MKKLLLSLTLSFASSFVLAQGMEQGNIMVEAGFGAGIYGTKFNIGNNSTTDGALPVYFDFNGRYAITDRLALGYNLDQGSYVRDSDDELRDPGTYTFSKYAMTFRYLFVNKEAFHFFTDVNLGYARTVFTGASFDKAGGFIYQLNGGFNAYFTSFMGFYLTAGYSSYKLKGDYNFANSDFTWTFKGANFQMGLTFLL